jgi:AraC-like DNA-binding protein
MSDLNKQGECIKSMKPLCYQCHAGLQEAVSPVMIDDRVAGVMMIGQIRTSTKIPLRVLKACKDSTVQTRLERAFNILPYVTKERFEAISSLFVMLVEYAVSKEIVALRGDWLWEKVNRYLDTNLKKRICLQDLACITGRSISTVSQALKGKSGKSFKCILNDKRLDRADRLLIDRPDLDIGEIAREVGFEDSLYFSRVYRKRRGVCPSSIRKSRLRGEDHQDGSLV